MGKIISLRRAQLIATVALLGAATSMALSTARADAAEQQVWETREIGVHAHKNPIPDRHGDPEVWGWMYGEADTPGSYLLGTETGSKRIEQACGEDMDDLYQWTPAGTVASTPRIIYNAGASVEEGGDLCAPGASLAAKSLSLVPEEGGGNRYAVIGWKSPITGKVTITGSVHCTDSTVSGIVWELDRGSTILLGPRERVTDQPKSFGPKTTSVVAGEFLYFEVGPKPGGDGLSDTTAVTLDISSLPAPPAPPETG
jgi:hypothetical protein